MQICFDKFQETDFALYFSMVSDPQIMQMIIGRPHTEEEARMRFEKILANNQLHKKLGSLKITDRDSVTCIGYAKITLQKPDDTEAEIGYMFYPQYWGKGYGTQTLAMLIELAYTIPQLKKLIAIIDPENIASRKILVNRQFKSVELKITDNLPGEILELKI